MLLQSNTHKFRNSHLSIVFIKDTVVMLQYQGFHDIQEMAARKI